MRIQTAEAANRVYTRRFDAHTHANHTRAHTHTLPFYQLIQLHTRIYLIFIAFTPFCMLLLLLLVMVVVVMVMVRRGLRLRRRSNTQNNKLISKRCLFICFPFLRIALPAPLPLLLFV